MRGAVVLNVETSGRCQLLLDGVLWGLPALCANGLFSGLDRLNTRRAQIAAATNHEKLDAVLAAD